MLNQTAGKCLTFETGSRCTAKSTTIQKLAHAHPVIHQQILEKPCASFALNVCQSVRPGISWLIGRCNFATQKNSYCSSLVAKKLQMSGNSWDCLIFDNFGWDFRQLLQLSEEMEELVIQDSLCTDTQLQFTTTNVTSKGLTIPRKCPIIHGDQKSICYSMYYVCN